MRLDVRLREMAGYSSQYCAFDYKTNNDSTTILAIAELLKAGLVKNLNTRLQT